MSHKKGYFVLLRFFLLAFIGVLAFASAGCSKGRSTIFIIDTSGSMKKDHLIDEVKASVRKMLAQAKAGDKVFAYSFDVAPHLLIATTLRNPQDAERVAAQVDTLQANGPWTDLQEALDQS